MKILTVKDASLEKIKLNDPEFLNNVIYVDIKNDKEPLYIQTPKMFCTPFTNENKEVKLHFKNRKNSQSVKDFYSLFRNVEKTICDLISKNSDNWFPNTVSSEDLMKNFLKTSLNLPKSLDDNVTLSVDLPTNNGSFNFEIYNQKRIKVDCKTIKNETDVVVLLLANELVITETSAYIEWEVAQMKVYKLREKILGCGIRSEESNDFKKIDIGLKKNKIREEKVETQEEQQVETECEEKQVETECEEQIETECEEKPLEEQVEYLEETKKSKKKKKKKSKEIKSVTLLESDEENNGNVSEYDLENE